jgi:predicted transposase YbfD/YdcC
MARLNVMKSPDEIIELQFDGKVLRGSFDHFLDKKAIQLLSVYSHKYGLIMAHELVEEKTNEIPVAQALIPKLSFKNAIYTCDAINCQEKTISTITATGNDFVVQVKENQKFLLEDCERISEISNLIETYTEPFEKEHGRITSRTANVFDISNMRNSDCKWKDIKCVVQIMRKRDEFSTKEKKYKDTSEISYYVSTKIMSAEKFNSVIRGHWGIENSNHYVKDVSFKEDASRIRVNPQNMAKLKSFALNILRSNGIKNIANQLYTNAINVDRLLCLKF